MPERPITVTAVHARYVAALSLAIILSCGAAHAGPDTEIAVGFPDGDTLYAGSPERMMRIDVTVRNYDPADGHYSVSVSHGGLIVHSTSLFLADRPNDVWVGQYQYTVGSGPHDSVGSYNVRVSTEFGTSVGAGTFHFVDAVPGASPAAPAAVRSDQAPAGGAAGSGTPGAPVRSSPGLDYERLIVLGVMAAAVIGIVAAVARSRRGRRVKEDLYSYPHRRSEDGIYPPPQPMQSRPQTVRREVSHPVQAVSPLSGTEIIILDTSAMTKVMEAHLGLQNSGKRYRRTSDYVYHNLDKVFNTVSGLNEQDSLYGGRRSHLGQEYEKTFKGRNKLLGLEYSEYKKQLDSVPDGLSIYDENEWIVGKIKSLKDRCSDAGADPRLRDILGDARLDGYMSQRAAGVRVRETCREAALEILTSDIRSQDSAIAAQAVAAAQQADVVFVSRDYDHHTVLAGRMKELADRLLVISLDKFEEMC